MELTMLTIFDHLFVNHSENAKSLKHLKTKHLQAFLSGDPPETRTPDTLLKRPKKTFIFQGFCGSTQDFCIDMTPYLPFCLEPTDYRLTHPLRDMLSERV